MTENPTPRLPSEVFAAHMRKAREHVGLTQAGLAQTLREQFGLRFERQAVLEIEKGKRRVSLDEAVAICAALDIAPVYAFTPWEEDSASLKVGGGLLSPEHARGWVTGRQHGPESSYPEAMLRFYYTNVPAPRRHQLDVDLQTVQTFDEMANAAVRLPARLQALAQSEEQEEEK